MKLLILKCFFLFIFCSFISTSFINPLQRIINPNSTSANLKLRINKNGLDFAALKATEIMTAKVKEATFSNVEEEKRIKVGKVKYEVKNIRIQSFKAPKSEVLITPAAGLTVVLKDLGLEMKADWRYKVRALIAWRDSGTVTASVSHASISFSTKLTSEGGKPVFQAHSCKCDLRGFNVKLRGGASWLYNLILGMFKKKIKSTLERKLCDEAQKAVNENGNNRLKTIDLQVKVFKILDLDYHLSSSPTFGIGFIESLHKGIFSHGEIQSQQRAMDNSRDHMLSIVISEDLINSAFKSLHQTGFNSKKSIDVKKILSKIDESLTNAEFFYQISFFSPPHFSVKPTYAFLEASLKIDLTAKISDQPEKLFLSLKVSLAPNVTVSLSDQKIKGVIREINPSLEIIKSPFESTDISELSLILKEITELVLPGVNEELMNGIPLPVVKEIDFINSSIQLQDGYVRVATDVQ